jgi:hypothetical protein
MRGTLGIGDGVKMRRIALQAVISLGSLTAAGLGAGPIAASSPPDPAAAVAKAPTVLDRASQAGIFDKTQTWAATTVDYDGDGDEDVWIGFHQWGGKLWSNDGDGTYTRVAASAWPRTNSQGQVPDRHDCAFADVDGNGLPDAYCSTGRNQSNYVKGAGRDNELWLQTSKGVFSEVGSQWNVGDWCGRGRQVVFLYANNDRWPDLFLGNETPRNVSDPCDNPANGYPNEESKLFLNMQGTGLRYAPEFFRFGAGPGQRCAEVLDYNGDGRDDLLACRLKNQSPLLYRNNGGTSFTQVASSVGLTTAVADAVPIDIDKDGDTDLVFATRGDFSYRLNNGGTFGPSVRIRAVTTGEGRSVAAGDADGDGDIDVYGLVRSNNGNPNDFVFLRSGTTWTQLSVPAATGDGDETIALHPFGVAAAVQFLALNGGNSSPPGGTGGGPVQLLRVQP